MWVTAVVALLLGGAALGLPLIIASPLVASVSPTLQRLLRKLGTIAVFPVMALGVSAAGMCDGLWKLAYWLLEGDADESWRGKTGAMPVDVFDPTTLTEADWAALRRRTRKGFPFVLRRADGGPISSVAPPESAVKEAFKQRTIRVVFHAFHGALDGIDDFQRRLLPGAWRAHWPLWFLGSYQQGVAHIDVAPCTVNFYYLRRGRKEVIIAPPHATRALSGMRRGYDSIWVPGSNEMPSKVAPEETYLRNLPAYYRFELKENSLLVFNNSGSLHHFKNLTQDDIDDDEVLETPEALSTRIKCSACADARVILSLVTNITVWWRVTNAFLDVVVLRAATEERKQADLEGIRSLDANKTGGKAANPSTEKLGGSPAAVTTKASKASSSSSSSTTTTKRPTRSPAASPRRRR